MTKVSTQNFRSLALPEDVEKAFREPLALVFKHSTICPVSSYAKDEVEGFVASRPGCPTYLVDVIRERPLSRAIAARTGVTHESPQALVLRAGLVVWHGSHDEVTADALLRAAG